MVLRLAAATIMAVIAGAYWGDTAYWGTGPAQAAQPRSSVHCLVFRYAVVGKTWVPLGRQPIGEIKCPAKVKP